MNSLGQGNRPPEIRVEDVSPETKMRRVSEDSFPDRRSQTPSESSEDIDSLMSINASIHADGDFFWSEKQLRDNIRPEYISQNIAKAIARNQDAGRITQKISKSYIKVLAILLLIEKDECFDKFWSDGVHDGCLPLLRIEQVQNTLALASAPDRPLECFNRWRRFKRQDFQARQYRVNPAFLSLDTDGRTVKHRVFDRGTLMPFLEEVPIPGGGYGEISKVKIQKDCHAFHGILKQIVLNDYFVVKRVSLKEDNLSREEVDFRREVHALKRFSGFVHAHLVTLLMTWDQKNWHCLLFPWAEKDLEKYWKETPAPINVVNPDRKRIQWVAKQILGMTGALATIHNPRYDQRLEVPKQKYARHGDIKPENILWYESPGDPNGILVIADLGLTTFNSTKSRSNIPGKDIPVTPGYRGPECDIQDGKMTRSYDIWTYGCLLLEMCSWALGGQDLRDEFKERRTTIYINGAWNDIFFEIEENQSYSGYVYGVKRQVSKWIAELHGKPACTQFFHDLLDLIENRMVVPRINGPERISSHALLDELDTMYRKVSDKTSGYCQYPCPTRREPKIPARMEAKLNRVAHHAIESQHPRLSIYNGPVSSP